MMSASFDLNAIAQTSSVRIVECLVEGTLIAIFAGLLLKALRRQTSGARFAVWFSALMAIAMLPFIGSAWTLAGSTSRISASVVTLPGSWAIYVFAAWAAVAAWHLMGVGRGVWHLHVLRKSCVPVDPATLDARLRRTLARNGAKRPVVLCASDHVHVPTAIGLFKPVIVIPRWVMQELPPAELNQILLHELAHLRRWDDWTNLAQKVVKALFFFHPAVWWIENRVSLEREMACDDAVLQETANPRAYAECLAHLAEKTFLQRSVSLAQAVLGRIRQTSQRVSQILDVNRPLGTGRSLKPAAVVAGFALVCVVSVSRVPKLIAFDNGSTRSAISTVAAVSHSGETPAMSREDVNAFKLEHDSQPVRAVQAKLKAQKSNSSPARSERATLVLPSPAERPAGMLHRADIRDADVHNVRMINANAVPMVFSETLFVVVGNSADWQDPDVFRIQLWRVMVFHPVVDSNDAKLPAKQT